MSEQAAKAKRRRKSKPEVNTAGLTIAAWCKGVPMSIGSYYLVPKDLRPRGVKIGRQWLILEPQREWLERVAQLGGVKLVPYHERPGYRPRSKEEAAAPA